MNCLPCTTHIISEEDELKALDRFLQCHEELPTLPPPPPSEAKEEEEEDLTDEERQKRFFQQQIARLKQQKESSQLPPPPQQQSADVTSMHTDPLAGHSFIQMIKAKFQVSDLGKETLDAWSKDFQVSNPQTEDPSAHMIEVDEGDLIMDEIVEDDQEELERSSTPYSWRFDEAEIATSLDLKIDNFVEDNDDMDFASAYIPSSILKTPQGQKQETPSTSLSNQKAEVNIPSENELQEETEKEEAIETLVFEDDEVEEESSEVPSIPNLQEMLAMMQMFGGHDTRRMESMMQALSQSNRNHDITLDPNEEVRFFTEVQAFDDDDNEDNEEAPSPPIVQGGGSSCNEGAGDMP